MAGFVSMKSKRKDLDDEFSEFSLSSPARKIRRLDAELPPIMEEEDPTVPLWVEQEVPEELASAVMVDDAQPLNLNEERAIILYKPVDNQFAISPTSSNISFSVHSDLVDGLKNHAFWPANPNAPEDKRVPEVEKLMAGNNNMAIVPWVPSQAPAASESRSMHLEEQMEAEEESGGASMEIDEDRQDAVGSNVGEGLHPWPQHCLIPEPPQNTSSPIMWSWG